MSTTGSFAGRHVLAELAGVDPGLLDDNQRLSGMLEDALGRAGATVTQVISKSFEPQGVTVLALLSESHASLHTYPELGTAFVDVFTCGDRADPRRAAELLAETMGAGSVDLQLVARGTGAADRIAEPLTDGMERLWRIDDTIVDMRTPYQRVRIARTAQGVSLFCDDDRQSTELSQLVYHEALVVPALLLADRLRDVLVIGSSEGVVSQIAVTAGAERVDHVDIDRACVRACAEHLPYGYDAAELSRAEAGNGPVHVIYGDGWDHVDRAARDGDRYDVIVVDLPDERVGAAHHNRLYRTEFLGMCRAILAPGGAVTTQAGCPTLGRNAMLVRSWERFHEVFETVAYYGSDEHEWAFLAGRADRKLGRDVAGALADRLDELAYRPESIDADALRGHGLAPYHVRRAAESSTPEYS